MGGEGGWVGVGGLGGGGWGVHHCSCQAAGQQLPGSCTFHSINSPLSLCHLQNTQQHKTNSCGDTLTLMNPAKIERCKTGLAPSFTEHWTNTWTAEQNTGG